MRYRNERIRGTLKVGEASGKIKEGRIRWFVNFKRREEEEPGGNGGNMAKKYEKTKYDLGVYRMVNEIPTDRMVRWTDHL